MRVFINYSRQDHEVAARIAEFMKASKIEPVLDLNSISPGERWWERLQSEIRKADAMIYILTSRSAASPACREEIKYAISLGQRVFTVLPEPLDRASEPPAEVRPFQWVLLCKDPAGGGSGFESGMVRVLGMINSQDVGWLRRERYFLERAERWKTYGRSEDTLFRDHDLDLALNWIGQAPEGYQVPPVLREYLSASQSLRAKKARPRPAEAAASWFKRTRYSVRPILSHLLVALLSMALLGHVLGRPTSFAIVSVLSLAIIAAAMWSFWRDARRERVPVGTIWTRARLGWLALVLLIPLSFGLALHRQVHDGPARVLAKLDAPVSALVAGLDEFGRTVIAAATYSGQIHVGNSGDGGDPRFRVLLDAPSRPVTKLLWRSADGAGVSPGFIAVREGEVLLWESGNVKTTLWTGDGKPLVALDEDQRVVIVELKPMKAEDARFAELSNRRSTSPGGGNAGLTMPVALVGRGSRFTFVISIVDQQNQLQEAAHWQVEPIFPTAIGVAGRRGRISLMVGDAEGAIMACSQVPESSSAASADELPMLECGARIASGVAFPVVSIVLESDGVTTHHANGASVTWTNTDNAWTPGAVVQPEVRTATAGQVRVPESDIELSAFRDHAPETVTLPDGRIVVGGWDGRIVLLDPSATREVAGGPAGWLASLWSPVAETARSAFASLPVVGSNNRWHRLSEAERALVIFGHKPEKRPPWTAAGTVAVASPSSVALPGVDVGAMMAEQWAFGSEGGGANFQALGAVPEVAQSAVTIALVDTGVIGDHPGIRGLSSLKAGYDTVSDTTMGNDGDGRDANPEDNGERCDRSDLQIPLSDHGTGLVSLIAAGAPRGTQIIPVRAIGRCGGRLSDINDSIRWAAGTVPMRSAQDEEIWNPDPADIINLSLGILGVCPASMQAAIDDAVAAGSIVVAAAGSDGGRAAQAAPGNCNNVITVGGVDARGAPTKDSNHGPEVDIYAPGGDRARDDDGDGVPDGVITWGRDSEHCIDPLSGAVKTGCLHVLNSGTSYPAALVSAALANLKARDPAATPAILQQRLLASTRESCVAPSNPRDRALCAGPTGEPVRVLDMSRVSSFAAEEDVPTVPVDGQRLALVISQSVYSGEMIAQLPGSEAQAAAILKAFAQLDFDVSSSSNLRGRELARTFEEFRLKLEAAGPEAIGFVYYSGHALQHPSSSENYLLGVDTNTSSAVDLERSGLSMTAMRDSLGALDAKGIALVVDAPGGLRGLRPLSALPGMLIAYSAFDGSGIIEGIYSATLAEELVRPLRTIENAFLETKDRVMQRTSSMQRAYLDSQLYGLCLTCPEE